MFDFDSIREILSTIRKNKLRTFLTGFAVAWGIFMLIILLASGNGLQNGVMANFGDQAKNTVYMWPGRTSMPYRGMSPGVRIRLDQRDYDFLRHKMPEIEYLSASIGRTANMSYGNEYGSWYLEGLTPDAAYIQSIKLLDGQGRFINDLDMQNRRKVVVITPDMRKVLFKDEDPIGKYILADNIAFQVIGVYDDSNLRDNDPSAFIPLTTGQMIFNRGYGFWNMTFTVKGLNTLEENQAFGNRLREKMGQLHKFDPKDRSALGMWNTAEEAIQIGKVFNIIGIFILVIGIASLMAGIVGVGNIMLITVKERTREIGIRKAIGATPASILWLIILEAILITTVAGYVGIVLGVGLTEFISAKMADTAAASSDGMSIFKDPTVDLGTVVGATIFLIVCGVLAGLMPAVKATRISPIEAMRAE